MNGPGGQDTWCRPPEACGRAGAVAAPLFRLGAYAEQVLADAEHVPPIPDDISDQAAAAVTLNCGTAYAALHHRARARPGETILIHAAGGVGTASGAKHGYLTRRPGRPVRPEPTALNA